MPVSKRYTNFTEKHSSQLQTVVTVTVTCPYCKRIVVALPEDGIGRRKTAYCKKHILECSDAPADEKLAATSEKKRKIGDESGEEEDVLVKNANTASPEQKEILSLTKTVAELRQEKKAMSKKVAALKDELKDLKLSYTILKNNGMSSIDEDSGEAVGDHSGAGGPH